MKKTDVAIIGAATSGTYLAKLLAERGVSVTVIEKIRKKKSGRNTILFTLKQKNLNILIFPGR